MWLLLKSVLHITSWVWYLSVLFLSLFCWWFLCRIYSELIQVPGINQNESRKFWRSLVRTLLIETINLVWALEGITRELTAPQTHTHHMLHHCFIVKNALQLGLYLFNGHNGSCLFFDLLGMKLGVRCESFCSEFSLNWVGVHWGSRRGQGLYCACPPHSEITPVSSQSCCLGAQSKNFHY